VLYKYHSDSFQEPPTSRQFEYGKLLYAEV
jgi:hypothetical protein